jgi:AraC-like DNA-binding protein
VEIEVDLAESAVPGGFCVHERRFTPELPVLSVSGKVNFVKDRDSRFIDPVTGSGLRLSGGTWEPRIHEAGWMRLDGDWSFRGVWSPFWRAYWNDAPGATVRVGRERVGLEPERVVFLPAFTEYECVPGEGGMGHVWIHFSVEVPGMAPGPRVADLNPVSRAVWEELAGDIRASADPSRLVLRSLAALHLAWSRLEDAAAPVPPAWLADWFRRARERLHDAPDLEEMARETGMGRRTFLRRFREASGGTPMDTFQELRIAEACRLLRYSEASIESVAEATGFADRHHFSRVFKRRMGRPPAAWRRSAHHPDAGRKI